MTAAADIGTFRLFRKSNQGSKRANNNTEQINHKNTAGAAWMSVPTDKRAKIQRGRMRYFADEFSVMPDSWP